MKKALFILAITIGVCSGTTSIQAQATQPGKVQEYRGEKPKAPLAGVEMSIRYASSTVSDKNGEFKLEFQTLQPGAKVNTRKIEKTGYEIFNKDALEQWNINPDEPFIIVMVRCEMFKELRDMYSRVSSQNYEKQYLKEKELLEAERNAGRMTEEELRKQIISLQEEYERKIDSLDIFVDRFARIDLGELTKSEQKIIELVQKGQIEEAIEEYKKLDLVNKYLKETEEKAVLSRMKAEISKKESEKNSNIDKIWQQMQRELNTLKLAGKVGYEEIHNIVNAIIDDPNTDIYKKLYLLDYVGIKDGIRIYESCNLSDIEDKEIEMRARLGYSISLYMVGDIDKAQEQILYLIDVAKKNNNISTYIKAKEILADTYVAKFQEAKAMEIYTELLKYLENPEYDDEVSLETRATIYETIGGYHQNVDLDKCLEYMRKAKETYERMYHESPTLVNENRCMRSQIPYAISLRAIGYYNESNEVLLKTLPYFEKSYKNDILQNATFYQSICKTLAENYFFNQEYELSEMMFYKALQIMNENKTTGVDEFNEISISELYNNIGYLYFCCNEWEKSENAYKLSLEAIEEFHKVKQNLNTLIAVFRPRINMATLYNTLTRYEESKEIGYLGLENCEILYSHYPKNFIYEYVLILKTLAIAEMNLNNPDTALELIEKAINADSIDDDFEDAELVAIKELMLSSKNK